MRYLLDTDHISFLQRQTSPEYQRLTARMARHSPSDFGFSVISYHEQVIGSHTYLTRARTTPDIVRGYNMLAQVIRDFSVAPVVPFDAAAGAVFDGLQSQRLRLGSMDLRLAAIALSRGLTLLTRNVRDFGRVPGLVTEDWTI